MRQSSLHVPVSRRDRPAKAPLSRAAIVETGLDLLVAGGLANLSLRRIATALDTGSASLYVYVENLSHLQALMLDAAYGEIAYRPDLPPGERVGAALRSLRDVLLRRRGLAQIAAGTMPEGEKSLRLNEFLLDGLLEAGVPAERAAWGIDLLVLQVTAKAAELTAWREPGDVIARCERAHAGAPAETYPRLSQLHDLIFAGPGASRFDWALQVLIRGIADTPLPSRLDSSEHTAAPQQ
jgi:AcrR family transcriptional regulator